MLSKNMKRGLLLFFALSALMMLIPMSSASESCALDASKVNQDPYPAVQGDYVKVVFQVSGIEDPDCGEVFFELVEDYPISFDPGQETRKTENAGTYARDFSSSWLVPYKVRVDKDSLDGDIPLEVKYGRTANDASITEEFDLNVKDVRTEFEIYVKDYNSKTDLITFEVINIGESDAEAFTIEIPEQENMEVKGSPKNVIGSLDSNDFTTAEFEGVPKDGAIDLEIEYTDEIDKRRSLEKSVEFNSKYFSKEEQSSIGPLVYIIIAIVVLIIIYFVYKKLKKKKQSKK